MKQLWHGAAAVRHMLHIKHSSALNICSETAESKSNCQIDLQL
jgi:hypothetical protein